MTGTLVLLLGGVCSVFLGLGIHSYSKMVAAKNSALILARVMSAGAQSVDIYTQTIPKERLATSPRWQKWLKDAPLVAQMAELLSQAGVATTVATLMASIAGSAVGAGVVSYGFGCKTPAAVFVGLSASAAPLFYYSYLRSRRIAAFEAQLPQVLEMLSLYLRSGRSLPQAFTAMADEAEQPAREELGLCAEEYRLGRPLPQALRGLAARYPELMGLKLFSIAVSVLGQTGGNLVEVLDRIRHTLEASLTYVLKLRSLTGEARNSAKLLGALPGVSMIVSAVFSPDYFNQFFETTTGLVLIGMFLTFWGGGILWLRWLMASKA